MPHLRFTVAPTSTKIRNDATRARRIWALPLLLQVTAGIVLWEEPKRLYHELKLFKTYHSYYGYYHYADTPHLRFTVAPTSTKIKNDAMRARRIWELLLLLQVPKLKTTPILHFANHQQHLSGHIFLLSFPNRGVRLMGLEAALFSQRMPRLGNESKNM